MNNSTREWDQLIFILASWMSYCWSGRTSWSKFYLLTGLPRVREMSGKNKIFSRSGKSQGILKKCQGIFPISPMSGNCQGILWCHVRELSGNVIMTLFLDWNLHHMIRAVPGLCLCRCLLGKYKLRVYWLLLLNFYFSKILCVWENDH